MKTMTLIPRYELGEEVYVVYKTANTKQIPCYICEGVGQIFIKDMQYDCPHCQSSGLKLTIDKEVWVNSSNKYIIKEIIIAINKEAGITYSYYLLDVDSSEDEEWIEFQNDDIFNTEDVAHSICEKRNKLLEDINDSNH